jgi:hypothetical protein
MPIKEQKWVDPCGAIEYLLIINILEHGSQQSTINATTLRIATEAWHFLPSKNTYWTIWLSFSITAVCFNVLLITDPLRQWIKTCNPFLLQCFCCEDNSTKEGDSICCSEAQNS